MLIGKQTYDQLVVLTWIFKKSMCSEIMLLNVLSQHYWFLNWKGILDNASNNNNNNINIY